MFSVLQVLAIPLAAVASWLVGAAWYGAFRDAWLEALGRTREEMAGSSSPLPYALSFVAELVMAATLAALMASFGRSDMAGGLGIAVMAWLGFVATTLGVNHAYTGAKPTLTLIDGGHWLVVLLVQGAVIGALS